jgi:hypothetical protein
VFAYFPSVNTPTIIPYNQHDEPKDGKSSVEFALTDRFMLVTAPMKALAIMLLEMFSSVLFNIVVCLPCFYKFR